jgi:hypothetical protein
MSLKWVTVVPWDNLAYIDLTDNLPNCSKCQETLSRPGTSSTPLTRWTNSLHWRRPSWSRERQKRTAKPESRQVRATEISWYSHITNKEEKESLRFPKTTTRKQILSIRIFGSHKLGPNSILLLVQPPHPLGEKSYLEFMVETWSCRTNSYEDMMTRGMTYSYTT